MFDPASAALVSSAAQIGGGFMQQSQNRKITERQMRFQKEMSSTAYQRAMADMRKAGLNPILAYSQGGASTPSGSAYQAENIAGKAASSALEAQQNIAALKKLQAETSLTEKLAQGAEHENVGKRVEADFWHDVGDSVGASTGKGVEKVARSGALSKIDKALATGAKFLGQGVKWLFTKKKGPVPYVPRRGV